MDTEDRVKREQAAYDHGLSRGLYNRLFLHTHHQYRQHRYASVGQLIRSVPHERMLEIGFTGWLTFLEVNQLIPNDLTCINISERELQDGIDAARSSLVKPKFQIMDAHHLQFPDGSFDIVFGVSVLHHLELEKGLAEVRRVLKPGGIMIFAEPLDMNPVGRLVRAFTPKARTSDERPFRDHDLRLVQKYFACDLHFEQLLSVPFGFVSGLMFSNPDNPLTRFAFGLDERLKRTLPGLGRLYRHVLIVGRPHAQVTATD